MNFNIHLEKIISEQVVNVESATFFMEQTMAGELSEAQVSAWLVAFRSLNPSGNILAALATEMRKAAVKFPQQNQLTLDTCGTGGDSSSQINISTLSALVLASIGCKVVKHGNRSVSSKSGSADLLESWSYPLTEPASIASERLQTQNFCFLFAPTYHPAMKYAGPVRKQLGIKTVFNLLGPLANPSAPPLQVIGVYSADLLDRFAHALQSLGLKAGLVVHSQDGTDEISPFTTTDYRLLINGEIKRGELDPSFLPLTNKDPGLLKVDGPRQSREIADKVITGEHTAGMEIVALNAGVSLALYRAIENNTDFELASQLQSTYDEVYSHLNSGKTRELVQSF
jgi:anthranilate phosphoribosyltransferase